MPIDDELTMDAEALREMFRMSNGNVSMQARKGARGWERRLWCEDCEKNVSVEGLILICKDEDAAFQKILEFCQNHRHNSHLPAVRPTVDSIPTETTRRIKAE